MTAWLLQASRNAGLVIVSALALLAGCSDGNGSDTSGDTTTAATTSTTTEVAACASDPRVQTYTVGLSRTSEDGNISVAFVDADPAPPAKGNNTWTVTVLPSSPEAPTFQDVTIATTAYMPDHGHTSPIKPTATKVDDMGTYKIEPVNLFMPGVWEITLDITPAGGAATKVKFTFCVAG